MNTIELLYQIFRARYSLNAVRQSLDKKYRLALIGSEGQVERLRTWLGEPTLASGGLQADDPLVLASPLAEEANAALRQVDAAIFHVGEEMPEEAWIRQQAEWIPLGVPCLWVREAPAPEAPEPAPADPGLPKVYRVDPARAAEQLPRLCLAVFPDLAIRLARDYSQVRLECARRMTSRTAARNAMVAAASSVTVSVPLVGQLLSLLAVTGETLVITASQLRLCLLMGALYGRPLDFFDRVDELWPVVGGAVGWRTLARQLVGFVPVAGPIAKASIAWSGTWVVGETSRLFYELGERLPADVRRQVEDEARSRAREEAARYVERLRSGVVEGGAAWPEEHGPDVWPEEKPQPERPLAPETALWVPEEAEPAPPPAVEETPAAEPPVEQPLAPETELWVADAEEPSAEPGPPEEAAAAEPAGEAEPPEAEPPEDETRPA